MCLDLRRARPAAPAGKVSRQDCQPNKPHRESSVLTPSAVDGGCGWTRARDHRLGMDPGVWRGDRWHLQAANSDRPEHWARPVPPGKVGEGGGMDPGGCKA